jgi:carboxylesterase
MTASTPILDPPVFSGFDSLTADQRGQLLKEALPQFFAAQGEGTAQSVVVCLHGFTGMTYEADPVAEACNQVGLDAVTVLLPGHGYAAKSEQVRQFSRITGEGLLEAARSVIAEARQRYGQVAIFGQSMGGAIALKMAAEQRVDACAVVAPALRLATNAEILIPLLSWASFTLTSNLQQDFYLPCYDFYHSKALRALWQVSQRARNSLTDITCPVYAAHSHNDTTIPPVVMEWLQRDISNLTYQWFDNSNHVLTRDVDGDEVCRQVAEFLGKTAGPQKITPGL